MQLDYSTNLSFEPIACSSPLPDANVKKCPSSRNRSQSEAGYDEAETGLCDIGLMEVSESECGIENGLLCWTEKEMGEITENSGAEWTANVTSACVSSAIEFSEYPTQVEGEAGESLMVSAQMETQDSYIPKSPAEKSDAVLAPVAALEGKFSFYAFIACNSRRFIQNHILNNDSIRNSCAYVNLPNISMNCSRKAPEPEARWPVKPRKAKAKGKKASKTGTRKPAQSKSNKDQGGRRQNKKKLQRKPKSRAQRKKMGVNVNGKTKTRTSPRLRIAASKGASGTAKAIEQNVCSVCSKSFATKKGLTSHVTGMHQKKKLSCSFCEAIFGYSQSLNRHIRVIHLFKPSICRLCNMGFKKCSQLASHMKTHAW